MIDDPKVTKFLLEYARPFALIIRADKAKGEAMNETWSHIMSAVPNDANEIIKEDAELSQGWVKVTGADLHAIMALINDLKARLEGGNTMSVISKFCTRALDAN